jgi:hypothetical protein
VLIDKYLGGSHQGNIRQKYQHYYQDDALDAILQADGLIPVSVGGSNKKKKDLLKPKLCPNCEESNTPDTKFCIKCKYVLNYDAYNETVQEAEQNKKQFEEIKAKVESIESKYGRLIESWERIAKVYSDPKVIEDIKNIDASSNYGKAVDKIVGAHFVRIAREVNEGRGR